MSEEFESIIALKPEEQGWLLCDEEMTNEATHCFLAVLALGDN